MNTQIVLNVVQAAMTGFMATMVLRPAIQMLRYRKLNRAVALELQRIDDTARKSSDVKDLWPLLRELETLWSKHKHQTNTRNDMVFVGTLSFIQGRCIQHRLDHGGQLPGESDEMEFSE